MNSKDFDFKFWFDQEQPKKNLLVRIQFNNLIKEIAYHEAGHFWADTLIYRQNLGFTKVVSAYINVEKDSLRGNVKTAVDDKRQYVHQVKKFYDNNVKRIACKIITLCAGYATYLTFLNTSRIEDYIGVFDEKDKVFKRFNLTNCPLYDESFDYNKVYDLVKMINIEKKDQLFAIIKSTNIELVKFMSFSSNRCAIGFIKNQLIKHNQQLIEGNHTESVIDKINMHTKNVQFDSLIIRIVQIIENNRKL
jgi:hypothetical protein